MSLSGNVDLLAARVANEFNTVRTEFVKTVILTQAEYDVLTPDPATLYVIVPEEPPTPGEVFDLSRWHLTIPAEDPGPETDAAQIDQPELASYTHPDFFVMDEQGRMVCTAPVEGSTTSGASGATRCEFREREADYSTSAWDPRTTGLRRMTITTQVDATQINPLATDQGRREAIFWQIHGESGTPPLYLAAEWSANSTGTMLAEPRVRLYGGDPLNGSTGDFRDNPIINITPDTFITVRCEVEAGEVRLWVQEGQVSDLSATPKYTFQVSEFTDVPNWYFKGGIYNKTQIGVGASGQSVAKISHFELIQP